MRICTTSKVLAAITASLLPFAPACASPLRFPITAILSAAITSAPELTSPITTTLPSTSSFCPERNEPL